MFLVFVGLLFAGVIGAVIAYGIHVFGSSIQYRYEIWEYEEEGYGRFWVPMIINYRLWKSGETEECNKNGYEWLGLFNFSDKDKIIASSAADSHLCGGIIIYWIDEVPRLSEQQAIDKIHQYIKQEQDDYNHQHPKFISKKVI